jgi:hypothetical protein
MDPWYKNASKAGEDRRRKHTKIISFVMPIFILFRT